MTTIMLKPPKKAEIILKEHITYDGTGPVVPLPQISILANDVGYRWLSEVFRHMAERNMASVPADPDDHEHISGKSPPFNSELSDLIHIRLGTLTNANRARVLKRYNVSRKSCRKAGVIERYQDIIDQASEVMKTMEGDVHKRRAGSSRKRPLRRAHK